jgi:hypothetical protein
LPSFPITVILAAVIGNNIRNFHNYRRVGRFALNGVFQQIAEQGCAFGQRATVRVARYRGE